MDKKLLAHYEVEDFIVDESYINYHFNYNKRDSGFWEEWLLKHPEKATIAREANNWIDLLSTSLSEDEYKDEFIKMRKAVEKSPAFLDRFNLKKNSFLKHRKKRIISYVVVILVIIFPFTYWFFNHSQIAPEKLTVIVNNTGMPKNLILSDSSIVTLLPYSSLQYPSIFKGKNRDVYLNGEAGFHVKRNEHFPFKVHTKDIITTVLGTIFNIKRSGDSAIVVELIKGKVKVNSATQPGLSVLLFPNERAVFIKNENYLYKKEMAAVPKNLYFKQSDFEEIAAKIKDSFGVTIMNESNKKKWLFTGGFKKTSAKEIVENICLIENLSYKVHGDTIVIK